MPYDEPDPDDPMTLVGVALPADPEAQRDMVSTFAEEFARLGYSPEQIVDVFREPFYAGAHGAWLQLGEPEVRRLVEEATEVWGRIRVVDREGTERLETRSSGGCEDE